MENNRMEKTCSKCGITKLVEDFGTRIRNGKTYVQSPCRDCNNKWRREVLNKRAEHKRKQAESHMKYYHGVSLAEKEQMLEAQGGCAICGTKESKKWVLDHCHKTEKRRGVLCNSCNVKLGNIERSGAAEKPWSDYLSAY